MNGTDRKIEIFAPFGEAWELTKTILFKPFDIGKWFVIGFAAFLASLSGGAQLNTPRRFGFGNSDWNFHSVTHNAGGTSDHFPLWMIPVVLIVAVIVLAIVVALLWVGSRGRFIFTDCIVRNRGAIQEPWREFNREANSFFWFALLVAAAALVLLGICALPMLLPLIAHGNLAGVIGLSFGMILFVGVLIIIALVWNVVSQLMIPIMYRQRCSAMAAFRQAIALIMQHPGPVLLYLLFLIVLTIAAAMVGCVSACITCCITAIPYIGTVILLPLYVLLHSYTLLFVRQFGPKYDAWAATAPPDDPSVPPLAPEVAPV
jgi:hypothetical protein